jgi:hypothetical protein
MRITNNREAHLNRGMKRFALLLIAAMATLLSWSAMSQAQAIHGAGTGGTIPIWLNPSTLGNSIMTQSSGKVNVSGGVSATGTITGSGFSGNGSGLTNVNAATLGGVGVNALAQLGVSNTFATSQNIFGNLSVAGNYNGALILVGNLTDSGGETSANVIGGFAGSNVLPANSVGSDVVGATIAGGGGGLNGNLAVPNSVSGPWGTVSGGAGNTAAGRFGTVGGGVSNTANGYLGSVVGGGMGNLSSGLNSTVAGGDANFAGGDHSMVAGGINNQALGEASFAAGHEAQAKTDGSFVWNDNSIGGGPLADNGPNSFNARASGGIFFYTAPDNSAGVTLAPGSGSWSSLSDRNAKANFAIVDGQALLSRLAAMPIATWNYKAQADGIRHLGPTAQDFHSAFGLDEDERHISTVDSEGVALAAIQALYRLSQQQVEELTRQVNELQSRVAQLAGSR